MEQAVSSADFMATIREDKFYHEKIMTAAATKTRKSPGYMIWVLPARNQLIG
jgi:hypothetical protein